jgi:hypothetical protein
VDRRGFYLPPADLEWSLAGVLEQLETELNAIENLASRSCNK